jgi:predicted anti-sigma-YlaC factor YlaD
MTCRESRSEWMEWARGATSRDPEGAVAAHLANCPDCAHRYAEQRALTAAFAVMGAEAIPSSDSMAAPIIAEFDRHTRQTKIKVLGWAAAAALAAAACLFVFVAPPQHPAEPPAVTDESQFVPIPYTVPLSPEERASVVQMEIPVSALIAAGFRMPAMDAGATVKADVLVSQDGRARAIRPLSVSSSN